MDRQAGQWVRLNNYEFTEGVQSSESPLNGKKPLGLLHTGQQEPQKPQQPDLKYFSGILNFTVSPVSTKYRPYSAVKRGESLAKQSAPKPSEDNKFWGNFIVTEEQALPEGQTLPELLFGGKPTVKELIRKKQFKRPLTTATAESHRKTFSPVNSKPRTLKEIRIQEKYREKAASQAKQWLQQVEHVKSTKQAQDRHRLAAFKRQENQFSTELSSFMTKLSATHKQNSASMSTLKASLARTSTLLTQFSTAKANFEDNLPLTTIPVTYSSWVPPVQDPVTPSLLSDDDSFISNLPPTSPL